MIPRMRNSLVLLVAALGILLSTISFAEGSGGCPVGLVSGLTLDDEFGEGAADVTRCVVNRQRVKVLYQINQECKNSACTAAYAIGNINNAIKDYTVTAGMSPNDFEIVAIVHSGGWPLILDNTAQIPSPTANKFQSDMQGLLDQGVKVYFCQNTARSHDIKLAQMIPGVKFVTSGVTAITDFQKEGYKYVHP